MGGRWYIVSMCVFFPTSRQPSSPSLPPSLPPLPPHLEVDNISLSRRCGLLRLLLLKQQSRDFDLHSLHDPLEQTGGRGMATGSLHLGVTAGGPVGLRWRKGGRGGGGSAFVHRERTDKQGWSASAYSVGSIYRTRREASCLLGWYMVT